MLTALAGCMIGPDYVRPPAATTDQWMETGDARIAPEPQADVRWWKVFNDPVLDQLVEMAYRNNPSLRTAGARVLEALAQRGIAIGTLFPQQQEAFATFQRVSLSENSANQSGLKTDFNNWQVGFDAAWELDVWGRFRRGIESADASLLASTASYDDVLLSLVAEVATDYVMLRTLEERLEVAKANVAIQTRSYEIAEAKYRGGAVSQLDSLQAESLLEDTRALIPNFEATIRQTENTICTLLGIPPRDLQDILDGVKPIPGAPAKVAVGIPADLMRRRPDIRVAERNLAAQSAQIGFAKADLFPIFSLNGTISLASENFVDLYEGRAFEAFGGPNVRWAILNYGRITNNVRVQDARYQALVGEYETTVLRAQAEVESAIAGFLGAERQVENLKRSVDAAARAVDVADLQYREGAVDYTRVLNTQQTLVSEQDRLVTTRGSVALDLVQLYKALGGGWEIRLDENFVPQVFEQEMQERTRWGNMTSTAGQVEDVKAAGNGTESDRGWWRWRWWWPKW